METIEKLKENDLQLFYFDMLKGNYLKIKTMLQKQKDIYTCYQVVSNANNSSIVKCLDMLNDSLNDNQLHIDIIEAMQTARIAEIKNIVQGNKKEIDGLITTPPR